MAHHVGETAELSVVFENLDGEPADPADVEAAVRKPDGTTVAITATDDAEVVGRWTASVALDQAGVWRYRFAGTDALLAVVEGAFWVRTRRVPAPS